MTDYEKAMISEIRKIRKALQTIASSLQGVGVVANRISFKEWLVKNNRTVNMFTYQDYLDDTHK